MQDPILQFESETGFKTLFQHATLGIVVIDESGKIVIINPHAEKLFGYTFGELVGQSIEKLMPEKYHRKHALDRKQYFNRPKPREMGSGKELYAIKKDGTQFPVEISLSHYLLDSGEVAVAFITDVTKQKLNTERLEREVASRTQQLEKMLHDEQSLSNLKSRFIGIASHEFRTPLSTILSSTNLIERYIDKGDVSAQLKHTKKIINSVNHLRNILTDFLSLEKLDEGMVENKPEVIDFKSLIDELLVEMDGIKKSGQDITCDLQLTDSFCYLDPGLIRACLVNLLSNAIKYSEEGSFIAMTASVDQSLRIAVKDQGIGIPKADQQRLFSRFFRASNVGSKQGTGLGLNIVKKYVEIMGGQISFSSEEGKGTTFQINIPIKLN